jgi:hypothetical protein
VRYVSCRERRMTSQDDTGNHRVPQFALASFFMPQRHQIATSNACISAERRFPTGRICNPKRISRTVTDVVQIEVLLQVLVVTALSRQRSRDRVSSSPPFLYLAGVIFLVMGLNGFLNFNRYVPLALAILASVIVNILTFHVLMAPSGLPLALFVAVLWAAIFIEVRPAFSGLLQSRWQPRA